MNRRPDLPQIIVSVDLAHEPDFKIGDLKVSPSSRQISANGAQQTLQPRVMQVLVALARAKGAVVTGDDLIESCWNSIAVGEDAIHRCIGKIREMAEFGGARQFEVETIPRVGYRLLAAEPAQADRPVPPAQQVRETFSAGRFDRRGRLGLLATAALIAAGAIAALAWNLRPVSGAVTIGVVAQTRDSAQLADGLAFDLARFANAQSFAVSFAKGDRGDYLLVLSQKRLGARSEGDVSLSKAGSPNVLWAAAFSAPVSDPVVLRDRISAAVSAVAQCALHDNNDPAHTPNSALQLVFSACETIDTEPDAHVVERWRRVVAREPENAPAMATLAFVEAVWSTSSDWSAERAAMRTAAQSHLQKARSLDGTLGLVYAAEATLLPPWQFQQRITTLDRGLSLDPDCALLHVFLARAREDVGWMDDAVESARRAVVLAPNSPWFRNELASALAYNGYIGDARDELRVMERLWPDSEPLQELRSRIDLRFGDPAGPIRQIDRGTALPNTTKIFATGLIRAFLLARMEPTPRNVQNAVELSLKGPPQTGLQNLVALGRIDEAYAVLNGPGVLARLRGDGEAILFRVNMRPVVLDRRFMPLAERLGLLHFWQSTGGWPDFCQDKDIRYDCKAEARRLHPKPT